MDLVEFSVLESVSLSLWAEMQNVKEALEAEKSGGRCSCDCARFGVDFAKMQGIIHVKLNISF